jgi:hypothetical protein
VHGGSVPQLVPWPVRSDERTTSTRMLSFVSRSFDGPFAAFVVGSAFGISIFVLIVRSIASSDASLCASAGNDA